MDDLTSAGAALGHAWTEVQDSIIHGQNECAGEGPAEATDSRCADCVT